MGEDFKAMGIPRPITDRPMSTPPAIMLKTLQSGDQPAVNVFKQLVVLKHQDLDREV